MKNKYFSCAPIFLMLLVGFANDGAHSQQVSTTGSAPAPAAIVPYTPTKFTTTMPEQNKTVTFTGTAGQHVSLLLADSTYSANCVHCVSVRARVLGPDGVPLGTTKLGNSAASNGFLDSLNLPLKGTYTIVIDPQRGLTGSVTATLFVFNDKVEKITPGVAQTVATGIPGQNARLIFNGTAGQQVSLDLKDSTYGPCPRCNAVAIRINDPRSGPALGWTKLSDDATSASITTLSLPVTGTYSVVIDPQGARIGSAIVALSLQ